MIFSEKTNCQKYLSNQIIDSLAVEWAVVSTRGTDVGAGPLLVRHSGK